MEQLQLPLFEEIAEKKKLFTGSFYPFLETKLFETIKDIQEADPLEPVVIIVPSMIMAFYLKRRIRAGGVHFYNFRNFAEKMVAGYFEKQGISMVPLQGEETLAREAIARVIKKNSPFFRFSSSKGFLKVFMALLKDFRQGGFDTFADITSIVEKMQLQGALAEEEINPDKLFVIFKLLKEFRRGFSRRFYDIEDSIIQAAKAADRFRSIMGCRELILYGFYRLDEAQRKLTGELGKHINLTVFLPHRKNNDSVRETQEWLEDRGFSSVDLTPKNRKLPQGKPSVSNNLEKLKFSEYSDDFNDLPMPENDETVEILSCPGEYEETLEITRRIFQLAANRNVKFEDMAVILWKPERYGSTLRQVFKANKIPYYYHDGFSPDETPSGKSMKLLLSLIGGKLPRFEVIELVTMGMIDLENILSDDAGSIPSEWDRISRDAGITEGYDIWKQRLKRYKFRLEKRISRLEEDESEKKLHSDLKETENLLKFVSILHENLSCFRESDSWSQSVHGLLNVFREFIKKDEYTDLIISAVRKLEELDSLQDKVDLDDFKTTIIDLLESNFIKEGRFADGCVHIFNSRTAAGLTFPFVFVPGMINGELPAPPSENPLFPDRDREIFNKLLDWSGKLTLRKSLVDEDPLLFSMLLSCCLSKLVITFPRVLSGTESPAVPSSYILDMGRVLTGSDIFYKDIHRIPGFSFVKKRFARLLTPDIAMDDGEFNETYIRTEKAEKEQKIISVLKNFYPRFSSGINLYQNRRNTRIFTAFDGRISSGVLTGKLKEYMEANLTISSPTHIEKYFLCPYRFFLERVIGIQQMEAPEEIKKISGLERGKLYHHIFCEFFRKLEEKRLIPMSAESLEIYLDTIGEIAEEAIENTEEMGITGSGLSWFQEQVDLLDGIKKFVENEIENSMGVPTHFEMGFGKMPGEKMEDEHDNLPGLELNDGTCFHYRGRIDRIDINSDTKSCVVIDYKTGKTNKNYKADALMGGRQMQLPLYLSSVCSLLPQYGDLSSSRALYYFATNRGAFKKLEFSGRTLMDRENDIKDLVTGALEESARGIFIPYPGANGENCEFCDFNCICPSDITKIFELKKDDPEAERFRDLKTIE